MHDRLMIRDASERDVEALLGLYRHLIPDDDLCPPDHAKRNITEIGKYQGSAVLIGEVDGFLTTSCTLIVIPNFTRGGRPYALIENVVTHSAHRGQGFGTLILNAACDRAWRQGCYKVMLSTGSKARSVLGFYENAGFEPSRTGFQKRRVGPRAD